MYIADGHTHCDHSHDSFVPAREMIENALAQGASYMAMTDHCDKDYALIPEIWKGILPRAARSKPNMRAGWTLPWDWNAAIMRLRTSSMRIFCKNTRRTW